MLLDQDEQVAQAAERSLVTLALSLAVRDLVNSTASRLLADDPEPSLERALTVGFTGEVDQILLGAAQGAAGFGEHRRRAAVLSALLVAGRARLRAATPGAAALRAWLGTGDAVQQGAIRSVLRWSRVPMVRVRALELLASEPFAGAAADRLVKARTLLEHELVLSQAHMLRRPFRAVVAAGLELTARTPMRTPGARAAYDAAIPPANATHHLSPPARLGVVTFTSGLNSTVQQRLEVLGRFLSDPVPVVRHGAMRAMPTSGLLDFCFDPDERVARSAALSWSGAGTLVKREAGPLPAREHRALGVLARSPSAAIRAWAAQDLDAAPDPTLLTLAGRTAARTLLAENRPGFVAGLRAGFEDRSRAFGTLALVRTLGLVGELLPEILALARPDTPPRLLATVVAALAGLDDENAAGAATNLLSHGNDRVRANAVETLGRTRASRLVELKSDAHHRVRANVIRAQVQGGGVPFDVTEDLTSMITDSRPMHRLAGVWLAARTLPARLRAGDPAPELLARITEAARFDDNPRVRARAIACSQRLAADLRLLWHGPHATHAPHAPDSPAHAA